jgi:hypothetical protein
MRTGNANAKRQTCVAFWVMASQTCGLHEMQVSAQGLIVSCRDWSWQIES